MKDKISNIVYEEFGGIYCSTCAHRGNDSRCDFCYRSDTEWSLSKEAADEVAEKIMKELGL